MPCASWSCYCRQEIPRSSDRSLSLRHSWKALDGFPSSNHCASSELPLLSRPRKPVFLSPTRRIKKRTLPTKLSQRCPVKISEGTSQCCRSRPLPSFQNSELLRPSWRRFSGPVTDRERFELRQLNAASFHVKHSPLRRLTFAD